MDRLYVVLLSLATANNAVFLSHDHDPVEEVAH